MLNKIFLGLMASYAMNCLAQPTCSDVLDDSDRLKCYDDNNGSQVKFELTTMDAHDIVNYFNDRETFQLTPHLPNYILPLSYNAKPNTEAFEQLKPGAELDRYEVKFQISGRLKIIDDLYSDNWDLWFGYTQTAWWQLYNSDESAPFRETNYNPEIFTTYYSDINILGLNLLQTDFGLVHQSNGRSELLSRSWNRVYANFILSKGNFLLSIQPWYRIPESAEDDDNPNIEDYMGYGNYRLTYKDEGKLYSLLLRNNLKFDDNKGGIELSWAFPVYDIVKLYLQYYNGYGESLIDYDHYVNRISLGILIYEWL